MFFFTYIYFKQNFRDNFESDLDAKNENTELPADSPLKNYSRNALFHKTYKNFGLCSFGQVKKMESKETESECCHGSTTKACTFQARERQTAHEPNVLAALC